MNSTQFTFQALEKNMHPTIFFKTTPPVFLFNCAQHFYIFAQHFNILLNSHQNSLFIISRTKKLLDWMQFCTRLQCIYNDSLATGLLWIEKWQPYQNEFHRKNKLRRWCRGRASFDWYANEALQMQIHKVNIMRIEGRGEWSSMVSQSELPDRR